MQVQPLVDLTDHVDRPVELQKIELLTRDDHWFVRVRSHDGVGLAVVSPRLRTFFPIFEQCVAPQWLGKDVRQLGDCVMHGSRGKSAYKFGMPTWVCCAAMELATLDLLGKLSGKGVGELAGGRKRDSLRVYLSHTGRHLGGEGEAELFASRLEATGARAIKYKIGGRMSKNADAWPGRTEDVVATLAARFPHCQQWADANGSYDVAHATDVAKLLVDHGVTVFEEPCEFDEYEQTATVREACEDLPLAIAGGEQDHALSRFRWQCEHRAVDILMPDPNYCSGLGRLLQVAATAKSAGLVISPHSPMGGPAGLPLLHAASLVDNLHEFVEWSVHAPPPPSWYEPALEVVDGSIVVPDGEGLGMTYDEDFVASAETVAHLR
ncbi:MAG: enolase C-terminal domain-like protein [Planctomycetota bacterium]